MRGKGNFCWCKAEIRDILPAEAEILGLSIDTRIQYLESEIHGVESRISLHGAKRDL